MTGKGLSIASPFGKIMPGLTTEECIAHFRGILEQDHKKMSDASTGLPTLSQKEAHFRERKIVLEKVIVSLIIYHEMEKSYD